MQLKEVYSLELTIRLIINLIPYNLSLQLFLMLHCYIKLKRVKTAELTKHMMSNILSLTISSVYIYIYIYVYKYNIIVYMLSHELSCVFCDIDRCVS